MIGIKTLTIGYTRDIELAEEIAKATGAKELYIETQPEGETLMLNTEEQAEWRNRDWTLEGRTAKKTLVANTADDHADDKSKERKSEIQNEGDNGDENENVNQNYSEGGRLKASMLV